MDNPCSAWDLGDVPRGRVAFYTVVLMGLVRLANAAEPPRSSAEAAFAEAERAEASLAFGRALALYEAAYSLDPHASAGHTASLRATALRKHAEGAFMPLAELERVRRDPALANDPREIGHLVARAESFPPGLVRIEVWILAAEAYAQRLGNPLAADALLCRVLEEPLTERVIAQKAARDLFALRVDRKDLAGAARAIQLAGDRADSALADELRTLIRRRYMHLASIATLLTVVLFATKSIAVSLQGARSANLRATLLRAWKPAFAFAAYVSLVGAAFAHAYERGTEAPFLALGAVVFPLLLLARMWGASGARRGVPRVLRAAACAAAMLAGAFLVAEAVSVPLLEGFGL